MPCDALCDLRLCHILHPLDCDAACLVVSLVVTPYVGCRLSSHLSVRHVLRENLLVVKQVLAALLLPIRADDVAQPGAHVLVLEVDAARVESGYLGIARLRTLTRHRLARLLL